METERMALSQRERDRLRVLQEVERGHVTQVEAARQIHLCDRQVRRLLLRLREQGDRAVIHGLRGRPSNRKLAVTFEQKVLARIRQRYADFGPTLAAEHLAKEGLEVSRETVRKWMTQAAFWRPRSQRVKKIHVWRERRGSFGELVMQDSSPFRWLENRGPACQLIALIDGNATSRIWARFTEHDTTEENLRTLEGWLRRYGRPLAHYTDKNSIFRAAGPATLPGNSCAEKEHAPQFGRALRELGIEWIAAQSPQAKGRIERLFETLQDRLVKEMRLVGNRHSGSSESVFGDALSSGVGAALHSGASQPAQCPSTAGSRTALGRSPECAGGPESDRRSHGELGWKPLGRAPGRSLCRASRSAGRNRTATRWHALAALSRPFVASAPLPNAPRSASPSGLRPPGLADQNPEPPARIKTKYHVAANHPWRKPWKRTFLSGRNPDISTLR